MEIPKYQLWMLGIALGALTIILVSPQTSWTTRNNLANLLGQNQLNAESRYSLPTRELTDASKHPADYQVQLVATLSQSWTHNDTFDLPEIKSLEAKFPATPAIFANVIRDGLREGFGIESAEEENEMNITGGPYTDKPLTTEKLMVIDGLMRTAKSGAKIDPDNAFFPTMLAAAYFAQHDNADAIKLLLAADHCPVWNEYISDDILGQVRLAEITNGGVSGLDRISIVSAVLLPQYAKIRAMVRMAHWIAITDEQHGDYVDGIAIRHAIMHIGSLMRFHASSLICSFVGIVITAIASQRPGGAPPLAPENGTITEQQNNDRWQQRVNLYSDYLIQHNDPDEAAWSAKEAQAGMQIRMNTKILPKLESVLTGQMITEFGLWCGIWLITIWIIFSMLFLFTALAFQGASATISGSGVVRSPVLSLVISSAIAVGLIFIARQAFHYNPMQTLGTELSDWSSDNGPKTSAPFTFALSVIPFLVFAIVAVLISWRKRVSTGRLLRSLIFKSAVPVISTLLIGYGVSIICLAREDQIVSQTQTLEMTEGEGDYIAKLAGFRWPELIPEPSQPLSK